MSSETVKVIVRCRPMNDREKGLQSKCVVFMDSGQCQCSIVNPNDGSAPQKQFSFDGVYYIDSTTECIYNEITYPLVEGVLEGYNATVFAYGQTGCGKSFTMQGLATSQPHKGIIPRAFEHIFEAIATSENVKYLVHAAYLEIYNEDIRDLLGSDVKKRLDLKEHPDKGVYVSELSQHPVHNVEDCEKLMATGWKNRSVGATLMNADSSRSHSIFTIQIEMMGEDEHIKIGKLHLVDLAGSEKISKTGASGDRLKEATKINLSLSALGNVISALVDGKSKHIPYRDSKLTRLLQDSLGGNTKTLMVACISPSDDNYDETLSTLRYANRAKNIKNKPKINQDPKDALLSEYQEEIRLLKELLEKQKATGGVPPSALPNHRRGSVIDLEGEKEKIRREYEEQIMALKTQYESEQQNYSRLQANVETLKSKYEKELERLQVEKAMGLNSLSPEQQEAMARLHEIEENMVGGERAHDKELLEKRQKKKKAAEKRSKVLEAAISKSDEDDSLLIKAYDNIQEELRVKTEALKKSKQKIKSLDREVQDLYSEFQNDRTDYLETIRKQDQQLKLYQGILDKVQSLIRRDCNYSNLDKIKSEALWSEETTRWKLPEVQILKIKLPPAGKNGITNGHSDNNKNRASSKTAPGRLESDNEEDEENNHSVLIKKFEANQHENLTENYFKPKRAAELIIKAQQDASRIIHISPKTKESSTNGNVLVNWNNHFNTAQKTQPNIHPTSNSWGPSPVQNGWPSPSLVNFLSSPEMSTMRRPTKLEALPIQATKAMHKFKQVAGK